MTRASIDLSKHKLAGKYRAPAKRSFNKRHKPIMGKDDLYRSIWRIVDCAVRDAFENHPEYLTQEGKQSARDSVSKRVAGQIHSYVSVKQTTWGRANAPKEESALTHPRFLAWPARALRKVLGYTKRSTTNSQVTITRAAA